MTQMEDELDTINDKRKRLKQDQEETEQFHARYNCLANKYRQIRKPLLGPEMTLLPQHFEAMRVMEGKEPEVLVEGFTNTVTRLEAIQRMEAIVFPAKRFRSTAQRPSSSNTKRQKKDNSHNTGSSHQEPRRVLPDRNPRTSFDKSLQKDIQTKQDDMTLDWSDHYVKNIHRIEQSMFPNLQNALSEIQDMTQTRVGPSFLLLSKNKYEDGLFVVNGAKAGDVLGVLTTNVRTNDKPPKNKQSFKFDNGIKYDKIQKKNVKIYSYAEWIVGAYTTGGAANSNFDDTDPPNNAMLRVISVKIKPARKKDLPGIFKVALLVATKDMSKEEEVVLLYGNEFQMMT